MRITTKSHLLLTAVIAFTAGIIIMFVASWYGMPRVERDIADMVKTCELSYQIIDGAAEQSCADKISTVEAQGFKVLSKNGNFWAESL